MESRGFELASQRLLNAVSGCSVWVTPAGESFAKGHNVWGRGYEKVSARPYDPETEEKGALRFALSEGVDRAEIVVGAARAERHTIVTRAARDAHGNFILHGSRFGCLLFEIVGVPDY